MRTQREWRAAILGLGLVLHAAAGQDGERASPESIARWIRELDDDSFAVRQAASRHLVNVGEAAIEAVAGAARGASLEAAERALHILDETSFSPDPAAARAAKEALTILANSKHPSAGRARRVLQGRVKRAAEALQLSGARLVTSEERVLAVYFDGAENVAANLHLLHELPDLERISVSTEQFTDEGAAELKGLPKLREINLFQSHIGDAGLAHLKTLPSLRRVPMGLTRVTDKGLVHLKDLTELEYLGLRGNDITDAGVAHLKDLTNLTGLYLGETKVTDAGLIHLRRMTKLNLLRLDQTEVTDAGLEHLEGLKELQSLDLSQTRVTDAGVERLQKKLPVVQIRRMEP